MEELISSIVILIDTREKSFSHITDYFDRKDIKYKKKALAYGDYSFMLEQNEKLSIPRPLYFDKKIVVERKGSLEEISGNLTMVLMPILHLGIMILNIIRNHFGLRCILYGLSTIFQSSLCQTINILDYLSEDTLNIT